MVFQLKKFSVNQDKCGMKITTSAMVFGAMIEPMGENFLEIGVGTGILSLMMAQRANVNIDGIEIEENAANQAKLNFDNSPFSNKINLFHNDINIWILNCDKKYDLIFCNPPFFKNQYLPKDSFKTLAKHDIYDLNSKLAIIAKKLLHEKGTFWVLIDESMLNFYLDIFYLSDFHLKTKTTLFNSKNSKKPFSYILAFEQCFNNFTEKSFYILDEENKYTKEYIEKMKDFLIIF